MSNAVAPTNDGATANMFKSERDARLYLVGFFFIHGTILFVFPAFLYPTQQNAVWLVLLMAVYGPLFGLSIAAVRYLPQGPRFFINREKPAYLAALKQVGLEGRWWTFAYRLCRAASFATFAIMIIRARQLGWP